METETMGRVLTEATIENLRDLYDASRGIIADAAIRRLELSDALVDTGATLLSLPTRMIRQLGLENPARSALPAAREAARPISIRPFGSRFKVDHARWT